MTTFASAVREQGNSPCERMAGGPVVQDGTADDRAGLADLTVKRPAIAAGRTARFAFPSFALCGDCHSVIRMGAVHHLVSRWTGEPSSNAAATSPLCSSWWSLLRAAATATIRSWHRPRRRRKTFRIRRQRQDFVATAASTPQQSDLERQIIDRYQAFWEARFKANQAPPNPGDPGLVEYATGKQLDNVRTETQRRLDDGLAFRRPSNSIARRNVRMTAIDGDVANLQDCAVNDGIIYRTTTGEVVNDDAVTQNINAIMRLVEGKWKLEQASLVQEWEGVAECAIAKG